MIMRRLLPIFSIINNNIPPIGNIYGKSFTIPLIGKQYIETEYFDSTSAHIRLNGIINTNGTTTLYYNNDEQIIKLSDNLITTMSKLKCKLNKSYYDKNNDNIIINLCFKSVIKKNIILEKLNVSYFDK